MTTTSQINSQNGFTLVEVLVAVLIMVIGVFATLSLISTSMKANTHANQLTTKTALAQQMIEDMLSRDKSSLDVPVTNAPYNLNITGAAVDLSVNGGGTYHATYTTSVSTVWDPVNNPDRRLVKIDIVVSSVPDDGLSLKTTVYKYQE